MMILRKRFDVDTLGITLAHCGQLARNMPPAWDGAWIAAPLLTPDGATLGKMLPGRGLYLGCDLRPLGFVKPIPYVYEDSLTRRLVDRLGSERGAIATYDGLVAGVKSGKAQTVYVAKTNYPNLSTGGGWGHGFTVASGRPPAGAYAAIPGGGVLTGATVGAFNTGLALPSGSDQAYLVSLGYGTIAATGTGLFILADLLVAAGGIDSNSNSPQTVNTTALTRYTDGAGVLAMVEVETGNLGSTPSNLTATYTNQAGTGSRSTVADAMSTGSTAPSGRITPNGLGPFLQLQAGDYGVRSVQTVTLSAAMGTANRPLAVVLYFPLCFLPGLANASHYERDFVDQLDGAIALVVANGAYGCLSLIGGQGPNATQDINMSLRVAIG